MTYKNSLSIAIATVCIALLLRRGKYYKLICLHSSITSENIHYYEYTCTYCYSICCPLLMSHCADGDYVEPSWELHTVIVIHSWNAGVSGDCDLIWDHVNRYFHDQDTVRAEWCHKYVIIYVTSWRAGSDKSFLSLWHNMFEQSAAPQKQFQLSSRHFLWKQQLA